MRETIDVVFNDSLCGALKLVKHTCGTIGEVVSLPMQMDMGTLSKGELSEYREKQISSWFWDDPWLGKNAFYVPDREEITSAVDHLRARLLAGEKVRIWYDCCEYSICNFYYFISTLPQTEMNLSVVYLREHPLLSLKHRELASLDLLHDPAAFSALLSIERPLPLDERIEITHRWHDVAHSGFPLRAYLNGRLIGVPEDFYDSLIRECIPDGESFRATEVERRALCVGAAPYLDVLHWRVSTVLHEAHFRCEQDLDFPIPLLGFLFHKS